MGSLHHDGKTNVCTRNKFKQKPKYNLLLNIASSCLILHEMKRMANHLSVASSFICQAGASKLVGRLVGGREGFVILDNSARVVGASIKCHTEQKRTE